MTVAIIVLLGGSVWLSTRSSRDLSPTETIRPIAAPVTVTDSASLHTTFAVAPRTLDELLALPVEQLGQVDIARMNLLCAVSLPGAEHLNIDHALGLLDRWAVRVQSETARHLYRVTDPRYADHYHHSEPYLRAEMLVQVLQQDLGVKYDMAAAHNFDFNDSRVAFIHGMIPAEGQTLADTPGGTCASMPVLVTAVGRRLGYPLKLVTTDSYVFVRWDGADDSNPHFRARFNMEVTNGFNSFDDDYYKTWPTKLTNQQVRAHRYLVSLTPEEELAEFLAARGHCGMDNGQIAFAARCYENACRYDPTRPSFRGWFVDAAIRSGYKSNTPVLAQLLMQRRQVATTLRNRPMIDGNPLPSQMAAAAGADGPPMPGTTPMTPRIGVWRSQPKLPATSAVPTVNQPPQPKPFRSQP